MQPRVAPSPDPAHVRGEVGASWALFAGIALLMLGNGLQGTLIGFRASAEGFATAATGVIMSGYYVGFLVGSLQTPPLLARVGHVRVFAALASLASATVLVHVVFVNPVTWMAIRVLSGFSIAGLFVVAESWLNDRATNENRGRLLSIYMVVLMGALGAGQLLLNVADPAGFRLFVLASVLVSMAVVPMSLTTRPAPAIRPIERVPIRTLARAVPLGVLGALLVGFAHGTLFGLGAVYGSEVGLGRTAISSFMGAAILGGVLTQMPLGRASDRVDRRTVIALASLTAAAMGLLGATVAEGSIGRTVGIMAGLGAATIPLYSLAVAHTNDYLSDDQTMGASATLVFVSGLGAALGPVGTSVVMALAGADGFFWSLLAAHAVVGVYALFRITRRAAPSEALRAHYEPLPTRSTQIAAQLTEGIPGIDYTGEVPVVRFDDEDRHPAE